MNKIILGSALAFALAGCGPNEFDKYLVRQGDSAMEDVSLQSLNVVRENDLLKLAATLHNDSGDSLPMQAKVIFFDGSGFEIDPYAASYRPLVLEPDGDYTLNVLSPNPRASSFKIHIREQQ